MTTDDRSAEPPPPSPSLPPPRVARPSDFDATTAGFHTACVGDVLHRKRRDAAGNVCGVSRCVVLGDDGAGRLVCAEGADAGAATRASVSIGEGEWRQVTPGGPRPSAHGWSPAHVAAVVCGGGADGADDEDGWLPPPPPAPDGAQAWASAILSDNREALLALPPREKAESQKGLLKRSRKLRCFADFGRSTDHRAVRASAAAAEGALRHFFSEEVVAAAAGAAGGGGGEADASGGVPLRRGYVVARECPVSCVADPSDPYLWTDAPSVDAQDPSLAYFVRGGGDGGGGGGGDGGGGDDDDAAEAAAAAAAAGDLAAAKEGFFLTSMYRDAAAAAAAEAAAAAPADASAYAGAAAAAASLVCVAASARVCRRRRLGGGGDGCAGSATQAPRLSKREKARRAAKGAAAAAAVAPAAAAAPPPPRTPLERVAWAADAEKERRHGAYEELVGAGRGVAFRRTEKSVRGGVLCLTVAADSADLRVCPRCGGARLRNHRRQVVRCGCGDREGWDADGGGGVGRVAQEGFGAAAVLNPSYARTVASLQVSEVQRVFRDDPGLVHNPLYYTACLLRVCSRYGATVDGRYSSLPASGEALRLEVTTRYRSVHPRYRVAAAAASCAATAGLKVTVHVGVTEGQMLCAGSVPVCADPVLHKRLVWGIAAVRMLRVWHAPLDRHSPTLSNATQILRDLCGFDLGNPLH